MICKVDSVAAVNSHMHVSLTCDIFPGCQPHCMTISTQDNPVQLCCCNLQFACIEICLTDHILPIDAFATRTTVHAIISFVACQVVDMQLQPYTAAHLRYSKTSDTNLVNCASMLMSKTSRTRPTNACSLTISCLMQMHKRDAQINQCPYKSINGKVTSQGSRVKGVQ